MGISTSKTSGTPETPKNFKITFNKNHANIIIVTILLLSFTLFGLNIGLYGNTTNDSIKECKTPSTVCNNVNNEGKIIKCPPCSNSNDTVGNIENEEQPTNCLIRKANAFKDHVASTGIWYIVLTILFVFYVVFFSYIYWFKIRSAQTVTS